MSRNTRSPIVSTSSVSLAFTAGGGFSGDQAQFDTSKLINIGRVPIEIRELRIMIETDSAQRGVASPLVHLEVKLGKHYLTDGPVPVAVMAPFRLVDDGTIPSEGFEVDNAGAKGRVSTRRIIFPRPLILPPGRGFMATASIPMSPFLTTALWDVAFTATVHLTMVGRFLAEGDRIPSTNLIPIISHVELTQANRISLEDDLRNPLSVPIHVRHLIGTLVESDPDLLIPGAFSRNTGIEFKFPNVESATEIPTDFPRIFGQCRVWPTSFDMRANDRIRAQIQANAIDTAAARNTGYQVALFGSREEAI